MYEYDAHLGIFQRSGASEEIIGMVMIRAKMRFLTPWHVPSLIIAGR